MRLLAYFRSVAARWFQGSRIDEEMEEELRAHIELRADDLARSGVARAEALRRARLEFGAHERVKEECRDEGGGMFIETLIRDTRYSIRLLRKSPGFTTVAVLTLALAIGANAVVFGILNAVILHPLNVPHAESLYGIQHGNEASAYQSYPDYVDLRDRNHSFTALAAYNICQAGLDYGDTASSIWCDETSGNYFDALGIQPYLGRFFHASDERGPNSAPYVVLGYSFWQTHFAADRGVIGRVVRLNKHPFTIIGVAPPEFHGILLFGAPNLFVPLVNQSQIDGENDLNARGNRWVFMAFGHLKPGVTTAQAAADLNSIGAYLEKTYPKEDDRRTFTLARPALYGDYLGRPARAFLTGLSLLAGLILLAACANLGSLFSARASDRARELALRLALGSSRNRIMRGLFTEALLISLMGGACGLAASVALLNGLNLWRPFSRYPEFHVPVHPDANVYAAALVLALFSALLFGFVPVRQVLRTDPYQVVKAGSIRPSGRRLTIRELLLAVQIAICAILVTSSIVAVRGLVRSMHSNFGFQPHGALLMDTVLNMAGYSGDAIPTMQKRMIDSMQKIPGVASVGLIDWPPLGNGSWHGSHVFREDVTDLRPSNALSDVVMYSISPGYLRAACTAMVAGRDFTWHDGKDTPRVAIVNREFAHRIFGSAAKAIGGHYKIPDGARIEVVGIAENGKYKFLTEDPQPAMFFPILQSPSNATSLVVRSNREPQQLAVAMRSALRRLDEGLPGDIVTWNELLDLPLFPARAATMALGVLGVLGAMLSVTGIFGMAAYTVSRRLKELGIRLALGARRQELLQTALGRAFKLLAFGSASGLLLGMLASRVLAAIVYHATPRDPFVLAGAVLAMLLLGLAATWIPAQRALSVDPLTLLREE